MVLRGIDRSLEAREMTDDKLITLKKERDEGKEYCRKEIATYREEWKALGSPPDWLECFPWLKSDTE
jgi:hypothetical protein